MWVEGGGGGSKVRLKNFEGKEGRGGGSRRNAGEERRKAPLQHSVCFLLPSQKTFTFWSFCRGCKLSRTATGGVREKEGNVVFAIFLGKLGHRRKMPRKDNPNPFEERPRLSK